MNVVTAQLFNLRLYLCAKFQSMIGIFAWGTGCSKQFIEVLSQCGLSISFDTIQDYVKTLSQRRIDMACAIPLSMRLLGYDNLNISTSTSIEQQPDAPAKVQSGLFPLLYQLFFRLGISPREIQRIMEIRITIDRFHAAGPLSAKDIEPSLKAAEIITGQSAVTIIQNLFHFAEEFAANDVDYSMISHTPRHPIPVHTTAFHPLRVLTTEEASIAGNLRIPDQVCQIYRRGDLNAWERRSIFQLGIGLFHLLMNLAWCILNKHRFQAKYIGSLAFYFEILDKKRLGSEKPDYYMLLAALEEIRNALLLDAWRKVAKSQGFNSLKDFAASNPSATLLYKLAREINYNYAAPLETPLSPPLQSPSSSNDSDSDIEMASISGASDASNTISDDGSDGINASPDPKLDPTNQSSRLLLRDLLYFTELNQAIRDGDFGRVEDILPDIAALFSSAGSHKYTTEILHLLYNLKKVWTEEFA
ncbi:hypothetical protein F5890DRAFT_1419052 [Lentinula detonsa]|uniref:DUF6589 domain-containing protein n=1 Tax=Lentinula detonsa TaxID=2804962 RepID=A0AA38PS81_9AGAR|nr:hypothetical protein F5890DRAFT_1419052 [Lentinula detonsa]